MRILKSKNRAYIIPVVLLFMVLLVYSLFIVALYIWGFISSLKDNTQFMFNMLGLPEGLPWEWYWRNYADAFRMISVNVVTEGTQHPVFIAEMLFNSALYAYGGAFINVFTTWVVSYLFVRFPFKISKFMYAANLMLMMVPIIGNLPSAMQIYKALGIYDTWLFVFINSIGFSGMYLLVFHAYHAGIGREYTEAAQVDGASNFSTMLKIIFPITRQMFFVVFLMVAISRWNDYMTMLIWLPNHPTLAYGLYKFSFSSSTAAGWPPMQIAGCMILMLPILVLFLIFQDAMMGNLRMGALKG